MRLAVALDLGDLVERLPARAGLGIGAVEVPAGEGVDHREHAPVGEIAVMRDRQHLAAGPLLVGGQPAPEVLGVVAAGRPQGGVGLDLPGLVAAIAVDHDAVEVVAPGVRRPLVADERGEAAGLVRLLGCRDNLVPGGAVGARARYGEDRRTNLIRPEGPDDLQRGGGRLFAAAPHHVVPAPAIRVGQDLGFSGDQPREEAHAIGMVGHDEEVERAREAHGLPRRGNHLLPLGEAVGVARRQARPESAGIHRKGGMEVGVAPIHVGGEAPLRIGRVGPRREGVAQGPRFWEGSPVPAARAAARRAGSLQRRRRLRAPIGRGFDAASIRSWRSPSVPPPRTQSNFRFRCYRGP